MRPNGESISLDSRGAECSKRAEVGHRRDSDRDKPYVDVR